MTVNKHPEGFMPPLCTFGLCLWNEYIEHRPLALLRFHLNIPVVIPR